MVLRLVVADLPSDLTSPKIEETTEMRMRGRCVLNWMGRSGRRKTIKASNILRKCKTSF